MTIVQVNTYIEDCIAQKAPLIKILRLVCMQSVCSNGLKQKVLDFYKREILQVVITCHFHALVNVYPINQYCDCVSPKMLTCKLFVCFQTYGYEHMLTLNNLEKTGLLKPQTSSRNNYPTIRKTLKLWMEDANEQVGPLLRRRLRHVALVEEEMGGGGTSLPHVFLYSLCLSVCPDPQRHLLRVQRLRSPQHPPDPGPGPARLAEHRGGAEDAPGATL